MTPAAIVQKFWNFCNVVTGIGLVRDFVAECHEAGGIRHMLYEGSQG
jgi:hypothetical protein